MHYGIAKHLKEFDHIPTNMYFMHTTSVLRILYWGGGGLPNAALDDMSPYLALSSGAFSHFQCLYIQAIERSGINLEIHVLSTVKYNTTHIQASTSN